MQKRLIFFLVGIVFLATFISLVAFFLLQTKFVVTPIQQMLIVLVIIYCSGIFASAGFEYFFETRLGEFLDVVKKTWVKSKSLKSISDEDLFLEMQQIIATIEYITKDSSRRIKELESKGGYDDTYYRLLTTMSHQLRTPVTGLEWAIGNFRENMDKNQPLDRDLIMESEEAVKRIGGIIENLLTGVQREGFKAEVSDKVDIEKCIEDILSESTLLSKERGMAFNVTKKVKLIPLVRGVQFNIRFILHCLVSNALNYGERGGVITINLEQTKSFVKVTVHNDGSPIPEKEQTMLFSQFSRGKEAIRINPNGSGLGLYLAKSLTVDGGGTLTFKSSEKEGTSFTATFPLSDKGELESSLRL